MKSDSIKNKTTAAFSAVTRELSDIRSAWNAYCERTIHPTITPLILKNLARSQERATAQWILAVERQQPNYIPPKTRVDTALNITEAILRGVMQATILVGGIYFAMTILGQTIADNLNHGEQRPRNPWWHEYLEKKPPCPEIPAPGDDLCI